jgi:hypothetical protein
MGGKRPYLLAGKRSWRLARLDCFEVPSGGTLVRNGPQTLIRENIY